jgi:thiamine biosynthesis protein ThiS
MSAEMIEVQVNGKCRQIAARQTVGELVQTLGLNPQTILVELNGEAPLRAQWPSLELRAGDRVELIRIVAGG